MIPVYYYTVSIQKPILLWYKSEDFNIELTGKLWSIADVVLAL